MDKQTKLLQVGTEFGGMDNTFNIDDVGYANASDVNMNAGALNSSALIKVGQSGLVSIVEFWVQFPPLLI